MAFNTSKPNTAGRDLLSSVASSGLHQIQQHLSPRMQSTISKYMYTSAPGPPPPQQQYHHNQQIAPDTDVSYGHSTQAPAQHYNASLHPQKHQQHHHEHPQQPGLLPALSHHHHKPTIAAAHQHHEFVFVKDGLTYTVKTADGQQTLMHMDAEMSIWFQNSPKAMAIYRGADDDRGQGRGEQIGVVKYHDSTSLKADLLMHGRPKVKFAKKLDSGTGLGRLKWSKDYIHGLIKPSGSSGGGGVVLKLESDGGDGQQAVLARFATGGLAAHLEGVTALLGWGSGGRGGPSLSGGAKHYWHVMSGKRNAGRLVLLRDGLTREQVEEVVASGIVEHERKMKEKQILEASGGGGGDAVGSVISAIVS
ncbi:hypothetical protein MN608_03273 [Microdochium nivale]|nr:hypothetical protein MN608_03273 [Microdochium nivale]